MYGDGVSLRRRHPRSEAGLTANLSNPASLRGWRRRRLTPSPYISHYISPTGVGIGESEMEEWYQNTIEEEMKGETKRQRESNKNVNLAHRCQIV